MWPHTHRRLISINFTIRDGKITQLWYFSSIMLHASINNKFINLQEDNINTTINFLIEPLLGKLCSFDNNHPPTTSRYPRDIDMADMSECGSWSDVSSLLGKIYKHTRNIIYIVVGQDGKNKWKGRKIYKWYIKKGFTKSYLRFYGDKRNIDYVIMDQGGISKINSGKNM